MAGVSLVLLAAVAACLVARLGGRHAARLKKEQQHAQQMAELHLATIEALVLAIDAKDQTAHNHIRRIQIYATRMAHALGMADREIQAVRTAALLHDVGKLAIPQHILAKPGPLTPEETQKVRIHPQVGADIIAAVPFPYPVAPLVVSHHERWDGNGYPSGLKGHHIPLGARILAVADYYEALTSDRPYQKAITPEAAQDLLKQESGKALDPQVVEAFVNLLPEMRAEVLRSNAHQPLRAMSTRGTDAPPPAARPTVFDDIALAHREIYALYQVAQTMGTSLGVSDTMGLIAPKLANVVPFSACALFVHVEERDTLQCRFSTGVDSELLGRLSLPGGQGVNGWVARNRRPAVNARPASDLEGGGIQAQTALQSALVCPLIIAERLIGTLAVYHVEAEFYVDDHRRLLDRVSEQAAAVINNSIVYERTHEDSLTDTLTGLPNTRSMLQHLGRELARAERLNGEVSLLVLDLDQFKEINDTHGHFVGDRALQEVSQVLRTAIRPYDICVRYAGDEFVVVLPGCGRDEAEDKRLELQRAIDQITFEASPGRPIALTTSAGAAVFPHDGNSYEELLAKADGRMYRDKSRRKEARLQQHVEVGAPIGVH